LRVSSSASSFGRRGGARPGARRRGRWRPRVPPAPAGADATAAQRRGSRSVIGDLEIGFRTDAACCGSRCRCAGRGCSARSGCIVYFLETINAVPYDFNVSVINPIKSSPLLSMLHEGGRVMTVTPQKRFVRSAVSMPNWVPDEASQYLAHVANGLSLRDIAQRRRGWRPRRSAAASGGWRRAGTTRLSMKRWRRSSRARPRHTDPETPDQQETKQMTAPFPSPIVSEESTISREARRILRRLCETDALWPWRRTWKRPWSCGPGRMARRHARPSCDRRVALAFAVKDWIRCTHKGRVSRYAITQTGKAALKRLLDEDRRRRRSNGVAEAATRLSGAARGIRRGARHR
jgi:hypothetical protein